MPQCQHARGELRYAAAGAEIAHVALEGEHRDLVAEDGVQPLRFGDVGLPRAQAVGVDVVDVLGPDSRLVESRPHGARHAAARHVRVERAAETDQLSQDLGPAAPGVLEILDDEDGRPLADDEAVPGPVEWSAGLLGSVVAVGERLKQALSHHAEDVHLALGAADEEEVGTLAAEDAVGFAQGQEAGDVALGDAVVGSAGVVEDRDVAGEEVGQVFQHPQRLDRLQALAAPALQVGDTRLTILAGPRRVGQVRQFRGDEAGPEVDAKAFGIELRLVDLAVVQGQLRGGHAELDGAGHQLEVAPVLLLDELLGVEIGDLTRKADGEGGSVEAADGFHSAATFEQRLPERVGTAADGTEDARAGDDSPTGGLCHCCRGDSDPTAGSRRPSTRLHSPARGLPADPIRRPSGRGSSPNPAGAGG